MISLPFPFRSIAKSRRTMSPFTPLRVMLPPMVTVDPFSRTNRMGFVMVTLCSGKVPPRTITTSPEEEAPTEV